MKCAHCGAGISQEMKNCPYCGTGVDIPVTNSDGGQTQPPNLIQIEIHSNDNEDQECKVCPKCKASIPFSKVIVAKDPPTIGQWILAVILGVSFIACFQIQVKDSIEMAIKIMIMSFFGLPLAFLLWLMFTRRFWICPACQKAIKVKRIKG